MRKQTLTTLSLSSVDSICTLKLMFFSIISSFAPVKKPCFPVCTSQITSHPCQSWSLTRSRATQRKLRNQSHLSGLSNKQPQILSVNSSVGLFKWNMDLSHHSDEKMLQLGLVDWWSNTRRVNFSLYLGLDRLRHWLRSGNDELSGTSLISEQLWYLWLGFFPISVQGMN